MDRFGRGGLNIVAPHIERLWADFRLRAVTAAEIEFYIPGSEAYAAMPGCWADVTTACDKAAITLFKIEKEKGRDQHEMALAPADPLKTVADMLALKEIIAEAAAQYGLSADFTARPLADQPGSGLHIHVHLEDETGRNVFFKRDADMSDALKFSLGGLLGWLPGCMAIFAPNEASYARFVPGTNAPTTVSWGGNNRTVALRLPDAPHDNKRIEHRVAGADADPARVMAVILAAMHDGLTHRLDPGAQIYGDASLAQYNLSKLPLTLAAAQMEMKALNKRAEYFGADLPLK